MTICEPCTPSALVLLLSTLVIELNVVSLLLAANTRNIKPISIVVAVSIHTTESAVLVELIASLHLPNLVLGVELIIAKHLSISTKG